MEYHCTKNATVATKIFEKGLEIFPDEIDFVLRYLGFLISINDETSWSITYLPSSQKLTRILDARALFEGVIGRFSGDKARPLWERWARYVYQFEHLEEAQKLEKRIAEAYPNGMSSRLG
jgi:cleavage stimulation factor subunit 3